MAEGTAKGDTEATELNRLQALAARRAAEAKATMPDFSAAIALDSPAGEGVLLRAIAIALRASPAVNGAYRDGRAERYSRVNLGVVLEGPVIATLFDADAKEPAALAAELAALRERDPERFTAGELAGATFTITGIGVAGLESLAPVLVPRQAAGLGVADARLTLVCDARVLGAAEAARFLEHVRARC